MNVIYLGLGAWGLIIFLASRYAKGQDLPKPHPEDIDWFDGKEDR